MTHITNFLKDLATNAGRIHILLIVGLLSLTLNSCGLIEGIFEIGVGVGIFLVIAVIVIVIIIANRIGKRR